MTAPGRALAGPSAAYLAAATEAGLLGEVAGLRYVADSYVARPSGESQCLIEYCDPPLVADTCAMAALMDDLRARYPDARSVLVRLPGTATVADEWRRHLTYLRFAGQLSTPSQPVPTVQPAGPDDRAALARWLGVAIRRGERGQGNSASDDAALREVVETLLDRPDRYSYVLVRECAPIGHVTLLCDSRDEVTGVDFVELFDVLVEATGDDGRAATDALVAAAVKHARQAGRPLVGHVVHPVTQPEARQAERVVASLVSKGWQVDYGYWIRPMPEAADSDG